jgi:DNA-binding transcriptional LysR family regulator
MHRSSTLQTFLSQVAQQLGQTLKLRIQVSNFDAMCRMVAAGVGVAVVPESAALRSTADGRLRRIALSDAWAVRPRYMLVREGVAPASHVQELMAAVQRHHAGLPG